MVRIETEHHGRDLFTSILYTELELPGSSNRQQQPVYSSTHTPRRCALVGARIEYAQKRVCRRPRHTRFCVTKWEICSFSSCCSCWLFFFFTLPGRALLASCLSSAPECQKHRKVQLANKIIDLHAHMKSAKSFWLWNGRDGIGRWQWKVNAQQSRKRSPTTNAVRTKGTDRHWPMSSHLSSSAYADAEEKKIGTKLALHIQNWPSYLLEYCRKLSALLSLWITIKFGWCMRFRLCIGERSCSVRAWSRVNLTLDGKTANRMRVHATLWMIYPLVRLGTTTRTRIQIYILLIEKWLCVGATYKRRNRNILRSTAHQPH